MLSFSLSTLKERTLFLKGKRSSSPQISQAVSLAFPLLQPTKQTGKSVNMCFLNEKKKTN